MSEIKKPVFELNLVGSVGANATMDFQLGEDENGNPAMRLGDKIINEESFSKKVETSIDGVLKKNTKYYLGHMEETSKTVVLPSVKNEEKDEIGAEVSLSWYNTYPTTTIQWLVEEEEVGIVGDFMAQPFSISDVSIEYDGLNWVVRGSSVQNLPEDIVQIWDVSDDGKATAYLIETEDEGKVVLIAGNGKIKSQALTQVNMDAVGILSGITGVGAYAFYNCENLSNVTLPNTVTTINQYAFGNCGITSIAIPDEVNHIGQSAFEGCNKLSSVTLPRDLVEIDSHVFSGCDLRNIFIPKGVNYVGSNAFYGNDNLESIAWGGDLWNWINIDHSNSNLHLRKHGDLYIEGELLTNLEIPINNLFIKSKTFAYCASLISATVHGRVYQIGTDAFYQCINLKNISYNGTVDGFKHITNIVNSGLEDDCLITCSDGEIYFSDIKGGGSGSSGS